MVKEIEKFLKAEQTAVELVEKLSKLNDEAISYKTATKELNSVSQQLITLIDSIRDSAIGVSEIIKTLKDIGTPEILNNLSMLENQLNNELLSQAKNIQDRFDTQLIVLKDIDEEVKNVNPVLKERFDEQTQIIQNRFAEQFVILKGLNEEIRNLKSILNERFDKQTQTIQDRFSEQLDNIKMLRKELDMLKEGIREGFIRQSKLLNTLRTLIIITLASSTIALIIGIISLMIK